MPRPPEDDAAAEAQAPRVRALEPCVSEGAEQALERPLGVKPADAVAEEAPDLVPARRDRAAGKREARVDPEVPGLAGERGRRDAEVEQRGRCSGTEDARQFRESCRQVIEV